MGNKKREIVKEWRKSVTRRTDLERQWEERKGKENEGGREKKERFKTGEK